MMNFFKNFSKDEDGAVTVDWVVLTAAVVGLGVAAVSTIEGGVSGLGDKIATGVNSDSNVGAGITTTE
ncbi:hypothetical protein C6W92_13625 [Roseovarius sp. A46]|uniref:Flp family type IVb pilin n=1 Tax=Roseovarius sp. A46 TaxID=2109331 RepID=UPI001011AA40|nr:hypothetical protein [Roseovarius sp. A46]RXV60478.1 hypothetical protein C6W92_13625 [Roseovarius sp. A46]